MGRKLSCSAFEAEALSSIHNPPLRRLAGSQIMRAFFTKTICQVLLVAAFAVSALSTPSYAWTQATKDKCVGDAFRLCSSSIGDDKATEACMEQKSSSLSAGCKTAVEKERAAQKAPPAAAK